MSRAVIQARATSVVDAQWRIAGGTVVVTPVLPVCSLSLGCGGRVIPSVCVVSMVESHLRELAPQLRQFDGRTVPLVESEAAPQTGMREFCAAARRVESSLQLHGDCGFQRQIIPGRMIDRLLIQGGRHQCEVEARQVGRSCDSVALGQHEGELVPQVHRCVLRPDLHLAYMRVRRVECAHHRIGVVVGRERHTDASVGEMQLTGADGGEDRKAPVQDEEGAGGLKEEGKQATSGASLGEQTTQITIVADLSLLALRACFVPHPART